MPPSADKKPVLIELRQLPDGTYLLTAHRAALDGPDDPRAALAEHEHWIVTSYAQVNQALRSEFHL